MQTQMANLTSAGLDFLKAFFEQFMKTAATLNVRNFFDVLIIAFLIYVVIRLLKETHSISAFIGVLMLLVFYALATAFDLLLTSLVLSYFLGIFFIIIAVVFQRELRRLFSAVGFWGFSRRFAPPSEMTIEKISSVVGQLARERTGALLVFPGRESIIRYMEGGQWLNGEISEPLLLSLFDKTSPGHDGAAVIEGNKIKKFSVHLPLAEEMEKSKKFGLRHHAALGLSERSDALVVVVSEEKGAISIARKGKLLQLKDEDDLEKRLGNFYKTKFPKVDLANFFRWLARNVLLLVFSFLAALSIFSAINPSFNVAQKNFVVTPQFENIPEGVLINDVSPQEIILTIQGRSSDFESFKSENLRVTFDVATSVKNTKVGWHRIPINAKNIQIPYKMNLIKTDPASTQIEFVKK